MRVALSICLASCGMTSLSQMPGTLDLMGLNSPRTFEGASGFGSQMSIWLGPPWRKTKMMRSEEHTSELQPHSDLVCRLLLEKKNHRTKKQTITCLAQTSAQKVDQCKRSRHQHHVEQHGFENCQLRYGCAVFFFF